MPNLKQMHTILDYSIKTDKTFTHHFQQKYGCHSEIIRNKNDNHTKGDNTVIIKIMILFKPCELIICMETTSDNRMISEVTVHKATFKTPGWF